MTEAHDLATETAPTDADDVLFVDLDGTLIKTDLLHEAILTAAKNRPLGLLCAAATLFHGKAAFKHALAAIVQPDARTLPLREEVLELIAEVRSRGGRVVLATATDERWARPIADELGLFDDVLASDGDVNLKGPAKLAAIEDYCRRKGHAAFDYVGDSRADLAVWNAARGVYAAAPSSRLLSRLQRLDQPATAVGERSAAIRPLVRALRPYQWLKNLLVFVPLITSHRVLEPLALLHTTIAFAAFSACASAVYLLNDLADIDADRLHPGKRSRPFAAAALPVSWGPPLVALLALLAFGMAAALLPAAFTWTLLAYFVVTCVYSLVLKRVAMLDVITLACLYAVRVLGGGLATGIVASEWLMAFSLFIFVSLAFAKRSAELARLEATDESQTAGRGYRVADRGLIDSLGPTAGYLAVLVLALYIQSDDMRRLYGQAWALWLLCPLLMYWISRLWLKAKRGELKDDPVLFALRDGVSLAVAVIAAGLLALASWK